MQFRLAFALSISVVLIGVAIWFRFDKSSAPAPTLVVVEQPLDDKEYEEFVSDFIKPRTSSTTVESKPLTNTDLIGRNLILDYVGLAASGGANEASINALALEQVEKIRSLNQASAITQSDIKVVSDVSTNFLNYKNSALEVLENLSFDVAEAYGSGVDTSRPNPDLYTFTDKFGNAYMNTANSLRVLQVPNSLAPYHLELINTYLSNASALITLRQLSTDPAVSFAGLVILNENLQKEKLLVEQMGRIIESHGI